MSLDNKNIDSTPVSPSPSDALSVLSKSLVIQNNPPLHAKLDTIRLLMTSVDKDTRKNIEVNLASCADMMNDGLAEQDIMNMLTEIEVNMQQNIRTQKVAVESEKVAVESEKVAVESEKVAVESEKVAVDTQIKEENTQVKAEKTEKVAVDTQIKEENTQVKAEKTQIVDIKSLNELRAEKLEKAQGRIQALYDSFGGQEKFRELNPRLSVWQDAAKEKLAKDPKNKNLPPDQLETSALLVVLHEHQPDIDASAQKLDPAQRKIYEASRSEIFSGIQTSLVELQIPYTVSVSKIPIPPSDRPKFLEQFPGMPQDAKFTRTGQEFRYNDQVVDISTRPPSRFIERDGLRVQTSLLEHMPQENMKRIEALRGEKSLLEKSVTRSTESFANIGKALLPEKIDLDTANADTFRMGAMELRKKLVTHFQEQFKSGELSNEADQAVIKNLLEVLSPDTIDRTAKNIEHIAEITTEIALREAQQSDDLASRQESALQADVLAREKLSAYITSLGLTPLGSEGIDFIIEHINNQRMSRKE